jgi:hypothetical protein
VSANLYCWEPSAALDPHAAQFAEDVERLYLRPAPPSARMTRFVEDLLSTYPDLTQTRETVWSDGPLLENAIGPFINLGIVWAEIDRVMPIVVAVAHAHGLHCYDPQSEKFYPASSQG